MWCIHMQIEIEKRGIPAVSIITNPFIRDAKASADMFGYPGVRRIVIPHPVAEAAQKDTPAKIEAVYDDIIKALTVPLTEEESRTGVQKAIPRERIACRGTLEQVNRFFIEKGMSDGLPIILPQRRGLKGCLQGQATRPMKCWEGWTRSSGK